MGAAVARPAPLRLRAGSRALAAAVTGLAMAALSLGAAIALPAPPFAVLAALAFGATCVWMFLTPRYEWSLAVLLLYLALADGVIRLATGASELTLLRDGLLYAIVLGAVARGLVRRQPLEPPPLTAWVVAFTAVVLVQVANPANGSFAHSLASLRPHLEWVPLFFLGYVVMRSARRLRVFFVLLLAVATVNGIVNFVQLNLSVDQFAAWGPGYYDRLHGTDGLSGRSYVAGTDPNTGATITRNRSFGLGSDIGFGGAVGMLALPGGLALTALARRRSRQALLYAVLSGGAVFAVLTSAQRTAVVTAVVGACAFGLVVSSRRRARHVLVRLAIVGLVTGGIVFALSSGSSGAFYRYSDIAPTRFFSTAYDYKGGTLALVPRYAADFPLGAGIGSVGPAVGFVDQARPSRELNGDSEATYLLVELGVAGFLVLLGFAVRLLVGAWRRVRQLVDDEMRFLLGALVAALIALLVSGLSGAATSNTPGGPFFWFAAGTLAFWLFRPRGEVATGPLASKLRPSAPPLALPPPLSPAQIAPPTSATRIRLVCGPRRSEVDGIRDYADRLASSLADEGFAVEVDHESPDARPSDIILLNYNPFSFGRWGFAPRLAPSLRRARARKSLISLIVHESYVPPLNWRWTVMGAWQRRQLRILHRSADLIFTPVQPLAEELRDLRPERPVVHLPVGSNVPDMRHCRNSERDRLEIDQDALVIAAFGTDHPSRRIDDVAAAANAAADRDRKVVVLNLGAGAPPICDVRESVRLIEPGWLEAPVVARHLATADLFVAPFVDGVSTRRTTLMAALQHGLPVVGTDGRLTDDVLRRSTDALTLVPVDDRKRLEDAVRWLAGDAGTRLARGAAGRELYERSFDWPVISAAIVAALR
jgi:glycosyltransferase involved in cell wall biosynthesis